MPSHWFFTQVMEDRETGASPLLLKSGRVFWCARTADEGVGATPSDCAQGALPAPGLQHLRFINPGYRQAFHRAARVLTDFK